MATREDLLSRTRELMLEAGEAGEPLLEGALQVVIRSSRFSYTIRSLLVAVGQLLVTLVEDCAPAERGRRGDVGDRRRSWLKQ